MTQITDEDHRALRAERADSDRTLTSEDVAFVNRGQAVADVQALPRGPTVWIMVRPTPHNWWLEGEHGL